MVICGYVWSFMVFRGLLSSSLFMFDHVWSCMVHMVMYDHGHVLSYTMYGKVWPFMVMYGHVRPCMILYGHIKSSPGNIGKIDNKDE